MSIPYSSKAVANTILNMAREEGISDISPMKLQKLVYYAHAWYLVFTEHPLIRDEIQAWKFGPVIPEIYYEFRDYGDSVITSRATELNFDESKLELVTPMISEEDNQALRIVSETLRVYGRLNPVQLSNLSHMDGEPWKAIADRYGSELPRGLEIPDSLIRECFLIKQRQAAPHA